MVFSFEGKRVLVTGGAGGLGASIVEKFYEAGATVFALDFNEKLLGELKKKLPKVNTVVADLSNWDALKNTIEALGPLDHLINNAGIMVSEALPNVSHHALAKIMNVNFMAPFNLSQLFAKNVISNLIKGATIVNITSFCAKRTAPGASAYCSSKAALDMLTKCLALELGPYDIRVNSIEPTAMDTPLFAGVPDELKKLGADLIARAPIKEILDTKDAANLVLYLSSPLSKMITGVSVPIDGGLCVT